MKAGRSARSSLNCACAALELFSFTREKRAQPAVRLTNDGNKVVSSETRLISVDTGAVIEDSSVLKKSVRIGSSTRVFTKEEQDEVKNRYMHMEKGS